MKNLKSSLSDVIKNLKEEFISIFDLKLDQLNLLDRTVDKNRPFSKMLKRFIVKQVEDMSSSDDEEELADKIESLPQA